MLPSFRLVVAAFLCSFAIVFVTLRLVETARIKQEPIAASLAVLPASSLPHTTGQSYWNWTENLAAARFDARFGPDALSARAVPASLTLHALDRARHPSPGAEPPSPLPAAEPAALAVPVPRVDVERLPAPALPDALTPGIDSEPSADSGAAPAAQDAPSPELRQEPAAAAAPAAEPSPVPAVTESDGTGGAAAGRVAALAQPSAPPAHPPEVGADIEVSPYTASIDPDRRSTPVANPGSTEAEPDVPLPEAAPKVLRPPEPAARTAARSAARPTAKPAPKAAAPAKKRRVVRKRQTPAAASATQPINPFAALFGGGVQ